MGYETHRFSVWVNCNLNQKDPMSEKQQDFEQLYEDLGFLMLPDSYTENGKPTRLVIMCHGAGGTVTTDDSQVEKTILCRYLVANGYAVMDVNGLPYKYAEEHNIDIRNNIVLFEVAECRQACRTTYGVTTKGGNMTKHRVGL